MKVLHVYKSYLPDSKGGAEQVIHEIACGTAQQGIDAEVFTLTSQGGNNTLLVDGHKVHRCQSNFEIASTPFSISAFQRFAQISKEVDIIHYHFPYPFADLLHLYSKIQKPTLVTYHSDIIKQAKLSIIYSPLKNYLLKSMDCIVATSPNYLQSSPDLQKHQEKVKVIPIGINQSRYPQPSSDKLKEWEQRVGSKFFLFIGYLRYYKGLHILLEAASKIDFPIVIAGDGPLLTELMEKAAKLQLHHVHFVGFISDEDKVALLQLCYGFVFPSHLRSEAFGVSLLEAAMLGKPLISCEISTGTSFINIHKETGLVIPPNDEQALRSAMEYLWTHPTEAEKMGNHAKSRYQKVFSSDLMIESYIQLYKEIKKIS